VLYASGSTGGQGGNQPPPALTILAPTAVDTLYGFTTLWAWETSGSSIIDYVKFEAKPSGGTYTEIGRDFDGAKTLRDGVNNAASADGFSYFWDFSSRNEGVHTVRATAVDTSGRISSDSVTVYLEPTPPVPSIVTPVNGQNFCPNVQLLISLFDEDISKVDAFIKKADTLYSLNLLQLTQSSYGDANGNPLDGNSNTNGEFGNHYSGPVAATQAIRVWYDRGYRQFMRQGSSDIPIKDFVETMAMLFDTRAHRGTYDENLVDGLHRHLDRFGIVDIGFQRGPAYFGIRTWVEDEERAVILGLSDNPGLWVAVDGFSGWKNSNNEFLVRIANPVTGTIEACPVRDISGNSEIQISGTWHSVDIMISVFVTFWGVNRQFIGTDFNGGDGWSIGWTPSGLTEQFPVFFRAQGEDTGGLLGSSAILLRYDCANYFVKGDYNGDDALNLQDLVYMIDFCLNGGPPPVGGVGRADANCDNNVNITDAVYFMNYMFGSAGTPCY
ncbi:MAG: dockerin type I repeat-containing protein, partial [Candidatus Zixiibacteriota bacterium]